MKRTEASTMRLALYQPDIPQNTGAMMRLCACLNTGLDIIEPCGFTWDINKIRRAGMDYIDLLDWQKHTSWNAFCQNRLSQNTKASPRLIALTTKTETSIYSFRFEKDDILLMGRESAGLPDTVHEAANARLTIPMNPEVRSLNVATAAALALGEALRQTGQVPPNSNPHSP